MKSSPPSREPAINEVADFFDLPQHDLQDQVEKALIELLAGKLAVEIVAAKQENRKVDTDRLTQVPLPQRDFM